MVKELEDQLDAVDAVAEDVAPEIGFKKMS
jgi:hypothetical protein